MQTYFLSVLRPIPEPAGGHVVTVLRVEHPAGLQWMREHADEIARRAHPAPYNALMIREDLPADEAEAAGLLDSLRKVRATNRRIAKGF